MNVAAMRAHQALWLVAAELLLVVYSLAFSLSGTPGVAVPLAVTIVLVAAAALVLPAADGLPGLPAGVVSRAAMFEARSSARQCDPDAAGHVRPRAPGRRLVLGCC